MNKEEAISKFDELDSDDPEDAHISADEILLNFLEANGHQDLAEAWRKACRKIGFWFA